LAADGRRRGRLQGVHRRLDLPVAPDEDDVQHDEQHEPDHEPGARRERGDDPGDREAGARDQRDTGGVSGERVRPQPRERVERRHDEHRQPRQAQAAGPAGRRREHRGRERG